MNDSLAAFLVRVAESRVLSRVIRPGVVRSGGRVSHGWLSAARCRLAAIGNPLAQPADEGDKEHHHRVLNPLGWVQQAVDPRVRDHHLAAHLAQYPRAKPEDDRV